MESKKAQPLSRPFFTFGGLDFFQTGHIRNLYDKKTITKYFFAMFQHPDMASS